MPQAAQKLDRASAVRNALCSLVARHGFHGASMSAVAAEAGVATGTAYVHYSSKDELVIATYLEIKRALGKAAVAGAVSSSGPEERFVGMWSAIYRHLTANRDHAKFLVQVDSSPYAQVAHQRALEVSDDPLLAAASEPDMAARLAPFPLVVLYELGFGPAVRMAAAGLALPDSDVEAVARACWRAISG
jgi:TetR/AcrR family transcriptional repressor of multidrug resistance operon